MTSNEIEVLKEIKLRLQFLENVGLSYLTLDRKSASLAGGEAQRIRLATQIGSGLVGVLYILDEPTIGLHSKDNEKLLESLKNLKNMGNSVLVVEHDEATIKEADHIIDLGPGAGNYGGTFFPKPNPECPGFYGDFFEYFHDFILILLFICCVIKIF